MESAYKRESLERLIVTSQTLELHLASVRSSGQISQYVADLIRQEWRSLSDQLARMGILQSWLLDSAATEGLLSYSAVASNSSSLARTTAVRVTSGTVGSPLTSPSYRTKESESSSLNFNENWAPQSKQRDATEEANALSWHRKVEKMLEELRTIQGDQLREMRQHREWLQQLQQTLPPVSD